MKNKALLTITALLLFVITTNLFAENWSNWRGPNYNGSSAEKNLPDNFSRSLNVKWTAKLPGMSAATPIIWKDKIFVSSANESNDGLMAMCLDRQSGKILWQNQVDRSRADNRRVNKASPSPVTDGKRVIFFYGNGTMAGFNLDGKKLWQRNICDTIGAFAFQWTFSSTPTLLDGKLYLPVLQRDEPVHDDTGHDDGEEIPSYFLCLNPDTGKRIFAYERPSKAEAESLEAFTTAIPYNHQGRKELLVLGGDCITGHNPTTGQEYWRWGTWNKRREGNWRLVPSAVTGDGVVLICAPRRGNPVYGVRLGGNGVLTDQEAVLWRSTDRDISSDVCTPAFYQGHFYVLGGESKVLAKIEPKTGKIHWQTKMQTREIFRASPTVADGKIYCMDHEGTVFIMDCKTGKQIRKIEMGEEEIDHVRSSVAVSQGNLFVRTGYHLYCIEKKPNATKKEDVLKQW